MRVIVDTNVFISYLLTPHGAGPIQEMITALVAGAFILLVPEALFEELLVTVKNKPHLKRRIDLEMLDEFLRLLRLLGEEVPLIKSPIPAVTRDPKDDYLLAYSLVGEADYLVTGDNDLLILNDAIEELRIVTPQQFIQELNN